MIFYSRHIVLKDRATSLNQGGALGADYRKKNHNHWERPIS